MSPDREKRNRYNWAYHIRLAERADLPNERKNALLQSLSFFRQELGEHFLKNSHPYHPIYSKITGKHYDDLILAGRLMQHFKSIDCNYDVLLKKIRSYKDCEREGIPFLEVAGAYQAAGLGVKFIREEPPKATPDLELINKETGEKIYIEISKLEERDDRVEKNTFYERVHDPIAFGHPMVPHGGKFLRLPSAEEETMIMREIQSAKGTCAREQTLISIENDLAVFGFSHSEMQKDLIAWLEEKKCSFLSIYGPPLDFDETPRISGNKLKKKAAQLPADHPGLIYIPVSPLYFAIREVADAELIAEFKRKLNQLPHVLGAVIYAKVGTGSENINGAVYRDLNCHRVRVFDDGTRLDMLFVLNDKCSIPVSPNTLSKVYQTINIFRVL